MFFVASYISLFENIADITATPSIPVCFNCIMFSSLIPPIAITGMFTASQIALSVVNDTLLASNLVEVENTAPTPR